MPEKRTESIQIDKYLLHPHIKNRMHQRGISFEEIRKVMAEGWQASGSKPGTMGKVLVFPYHAEWQGCHYEEKEVTVYLKMLRLMV